MGQEILLYAGNRETAAAAVGSVGGRLSHVLGPRAFVADLPVDVDPKRLSGVSTATPDNLDSVACFLSEAWRQRDSVPRDEGRILGWQALGHQSRGVNDPPVPTSSYLTGTAAVGVVMVTGNPWTAVQSTPSVTLSYVAAAADGSATVWGVNSAGAAVRWDPVGKRWTVMSGTGLLTEISVGSATVVWGHNNTNHAVFRWDGASNFNRVAAPSSGAIVSVSAGGDGTVWAVTTAKGVFRWDGAAWQTSVGTLTRIAVGNQTTMWGLNGNDVYQWGGTSWAVVPGSLSKISVASDGTVYGIDSTGQTVHYTPIDPTETNPYCLWQPVSSLSQISVGSKSNIWGINSSGGVFTGGVSSGLDFSATETSLIMSQVSAAKTFLESAEPLANVRLTVEYQLVSVAVMPGPDQTQPNYWQKMEAPWRNAALEAMGLPGNLDGSRAYVERIKRNYDTDWANVVYITKYPLYKPGYSNEERSILRYDVPPDGPSASLNRVFAHEFCHVYGTADEYGGCTCEETSGYFDYPNGNCITCTGPAQLPCLMNRTTLNFCDFTRGQLGWSIWEKRRADVSWISSAQDGTVWGIDRTGATIRRTATGDWEAKGGQLTQISAGNASTVWGLNNTDVWRWTADGGWAQVGAGKRSISVGADGTVCSVDSASPYVPYIWDSTTSGWRAMPAVPSGGVLKQISVGGATMIWGLGVAGALWRWEPATGWWIVAQPSSGQLTNISVGSDGTVWGINGTTPQRWNGSQWQGTSGSLVQVAYGGQQYLWGTDGNLNAFQRRILATP